MDVSRFPRISYIHLGGPLRIDAELEQPPQDLALTGRVRVGAVDEAEARRSAVVARDGVARHERSRGDDEEVVAAGVLNECCCGAGGAVVGQTAAAPAFATSASSVGSTPLTPTAPTQ